MRKLFVFSSAFKIFALLSSLFIVSIFGCAGHNIDKGSSHNLKITVDSAQGTSVAVENNVDNCPALNGEDGCKLTNMGMILKDTLVIYLFSGMSVSDVVRMKKDFDKVTAYTDIRKGRIFIDSPGGDAFSGLAMADMILRLRGEGWEIEADAVGIVASAAVPVFAVCKPRTASPGTIFMVHEAALWKWPGRESASDIRSQNDLMVLLQNRYLNYLVNATDIDLAKWIEMEKATTWFSAEKGQEIGLVDHIK